MTTLSQMPGGRFRDPSGNEDVWVRKRLKKINAGFKPEVVSTPLSEPGAELEFEYRR